MTVITRFEDIIAWQKAQDLAVLIYENFKTSQEFGFKNQIFRAVISISNNIAEGFERKGNKEFAQFLHIALSSASEVKSMLYLAERLQFISENEKDKMIDLVIEISKLIQGFIKSIK